MTKFSITMDLERETKGTVRYAEQGEPDAYKIGTLYIKKSALGSPFPQQLRVTVEEL